MIRTAVVALGKIAHDQHLPTIAASPQFELVAAASPGATVTEVEMLTALASRTGRSLFAAWHSRHASGVGRARAWLADRRVQSIGIRWQEDVRYWHAGQQWIWNPGGMGIFDSGINALSIATQLLPDSIRIVAGTLKVPRNSVTPIAAELQMQSAGGVPIHAVLDWRSAGEPVWDIEVKTDAEALHLSQGGARLHIGSRECELGSEREYSRLYRHFAQLIAGRQIDADVAPLRLVADCFLRCASQAVEPFHDQAQ